jgi:carbon monoxide dehydrogenase subunit G
MQLEQSIVVRADPDLTYAFLLDVDRVAACVPGVSSVVATSPDTFEGLLKVKVGPIGVTYRGTASITSRDPAARRATIAAEGTEGVGAGRVKATATMDVVPEGDGCLVRIVTDLSIAGRLAQFGRGVIDGVAKRIVADMADCLRRELEADDRDGAPRASGLPG